MPSTNLDFNVTATTSQARAEIKLLSEELKIVGQQMRAALKAGDAAGARALADTFGKMETQLVGLKRQSNGTSGAMGELGRTAAITQRSFRSLEQGTFALVKSFAGAQEAAAAFALVLGAQRLGRVIGDTVDGLNKLQQVASNANLKPEQVKQFQDSMQRAGIGVDDANQSLLAFTKVATDARMKAGLLGNTFGVRVMSGAQDAATGLLYLNTATGKFVETMRGGASNAIKDFADPLPKLGVDVRRFGNDFVGMQKAAAQGVQAWKQVSNEIAAGLAKAAGFGEDWDKVTKQLAGGLDTNPLNAYNKAWGELVITINRGLQEAVTTWLPDLTAALTAMAPVIKSVVDELKPMFTEIRDFVQTTKQEIQGVIELFNSLVNIAKNVGNFATTAASAVSGALPGTGNAQTASPFAAGGYIRGPGSGTSDSILARLSNGEFVMRAAAVDRWGPQFMMALNNLRNPFGYAGGGLVRPPRFATGGMVTATTADGVTVNLNFPGGTFALRGDREIVGGLTREARRAGMLSAGRMAGALA